MQKNTVQVAKPLFLSHLFTHWELARPEIQWLFRCWKMMSNIEF